MSGLFEVRRTNEAYIILPDGHVFFCKGLNDRKARGAGFLINENLAGNIEEFFSMNERVAGVIIKLNKRYKLKLLQVYAPTSTHNDEEVEQFYEEVEKQREKHNTHSSKVMGDFNAKIGMKNDGESAVGHFGFGISNGRGDKLVEFAERKRLRITNTFFQKKKTYKKLTLKSPDGETKNEIDFIRTGKPDIVKDVIVKKYPNAATTER